MAIAWPKWLSAMAAAEVEGSRSVEKPSIIFILSDDVGLGDVACTGGKYPTPNIDALAKSGTIFEHCYSTPLCGPSRSQILTGRYPFRTGMISNGSGGVRILFLFSEQ